MTPRIAHVWMPRGVDSVKVHGDWPPYIDRDGWRYEPDLLPDQTPFIHRGARTGTEFLVYRVRGRLTCTEAAEVATALEARAERAEARGRTADLTRQDSAGDRRAARSPYRRRQSAGEP